MELNKFTDAYTNLNPEQRAAVDRIEGPVMVIAGPGTGKTQILAVRILNILQNTDIAPGNILCLTYTDAGSFAMQKRLSSFMGNDAFKVHIHTFHGLCNLIIRENPEWFGNTGLQLMDELLEFELLNTLIQSLPADSPLKNWNEDPAYVRSDLKSVFAFMQQENVGLEEIQARIDWLSVKENFEITFPEKCYKKNGKDYKAGDAKPIEYQKSLGKWTKFLEAASIFNDYQTLKNKRKLYEFSDMLHWVTDLFDTNTEALLYYQERFQYILVDEYQDTSGVQNKLLFQLISFWENNPNCFVVGDDDQSIYRFQGARIDNMQEFREKFAENLFTVVLTQNYRSTSTILTAADQLISNNSGRLVYTNPGLSKKLVSAKVEVNNLNPVVIPYQNEFHEAAGTAEAILGICQKYGWQFSDIAIIYSKHQLSERILDVFKEKDIPFNLVKNINILKQPIIKHLLIWIDFIAEEIRQPGNAEYLIYQLMHAGEWKLKPESILEFVLYNQESKKNGFQNKWRAVAENFTGTGSGVLKPFFDTISDLILNTHLNSLPEQVMNIINKGLLLKQALSAPDTEFQLELLHTMMSFVKTKAEENPGWDLSELSALLKQMLLSDFPIPMEYRIGSKLGVNLTTAHGSKGLEFKAVYIIGANKNNWESSTSGRMPFGIKEVFGRHTEAEEDELFEEKRRLFYVAVTRAEILLNISYATHTLNRKEQHASQFIAEMPALYQENPQLDEEYLKQLHQAFLTVKQAPRIKLVEAGWLQKRIENFVFSPTSIADLYECGLKFYYKSLLRVPDAGSEYMSFGNVWHEVLRRYFRKASGNQPEWMESKEVLEIFEAEMSKSRGLFGSTAYINRLKQGLTYLPQYFEERNSLFQTQTQVEIEKPFVSLINGISVKARMDKVVFKDNLAEVTDYKTGNPKNAVNKIRAPKSLDGTTAFPARYWFQLGMYLLIIQNYYQGKYQARTAYIDCLEKDENGKFPLIPIYYTSEQLNWISSLVVGAKEKLQSYSFLEGCGKSNCEWCNFVRETNQALPAMEE